MRVPSPTSRSRKRVYLSLWDLTWAVGSPLLALYLRDPEIFSRTDLSAIGYYWALAAGFAILAFFAFKIHDNMTPYFSVHEAIDIVETVLFVELLTFISLFTLNHFDGIPRSIPLTHGLLLAAALFAARIFIRIVRSDDEAQPTYAYSGERIILIGANPVSGLFIRLLSAYAPQRQHVIALLDAEATMIGRAIAGVQVVGNAQDLEAIVKEYAIHGVTVSRVVIAGEVDFLTPIVLHEVERICLRHRINLSFLPRMVGLTDRNRTEVAVASAPKAAMPSIALPSYLRFRRPLDIIGSLVMLLLLTPLLAIAAVLVLIDVGSPVLFWQERLGWHGRSFLIYKFRTLASPFDSDGNPLVAGREPSAIGRLLRVTRIDELPQLLNVLFGDMSLIGPRPLLPEDQPENAAVRLLVRPGISGWAQVNGGKLVSKEDKEKLDEWYVRNASLWLDLCIGMMTLKFCLPGRTSHEEASADTEQVQLKNAPLQQTVATPSFGVGETHRRAS
jgi:lipopolysaccharide/colanic/teichoic acid biosynthesis glycosyltransferase